MLLFGPKLFIVVNFILSFLTFIIGCWAYAKTRNKTPFYVGIAFGLFSLSHLISLLGIHRSFRETLILIRMFGYFIVLTTLYHIGRKRV